MKNLKTFEKSETEEQEKIIGELRFSEINVDVYMYKGITFANRKHSSTDVFGWMLSGSHEDVFNDFYTETLEVHVHNGGLFLGDTLEDVKMVIDNYWIEKYAKKFNI
jgi:hypothetical protein